MKWFPIEPTLKSKACANCMNNSEIDDKSFTANYYHDLLAQCTKDGRQGKFPGVKLDADEECARSLTGVFCSITNTRIAC